MEVQINYSLPEDADELECAVDGWKWYGVLQDFKERLDATVIQSEQHMAASVLGLRAAQALFEVVVREYGVELRPFVDEDSAQDVEDASDLAPSHPPEPMDDEDTPAKTYLTDVSGDDDDDEDGSH